MPTYENFWTVTILPWRSGDSPRQRGGGRPRHGAHNPVSSLRCCLRHHVARGLRHCRQRTRVRHQLLHLAAPGSRRPVSAKRLRHRDRSALLLHSVRPHPAPLVPLPHRAAGILDGLLGVCHCAPHLAPAWLRLELRGSNHSVALLHRLRRCSGCRTQQPAAAPDCNPGLCLSCGLWSGANVDGNPDALRRTPSQPVGTD